VQALPVPVVSLPVIGSREVAVAGRVPARAACCAEGHLTPPWAPLKITDRREQPVPQLAASAAARCVASNS